MLDCRTSEEALGEFWRSWLAPCDRASDRAVIRTRGTRHESPLSASASSCSAAQALLETLTGTALPRWLGVVDRFRAHAPEGSISTASLRASGASM